MSKKTFVAMLGMVLATIAGGQPPQAGESRASWMRGKYGLMVHWLYPSEGDVDGWTDRFDLPGFLGDFKRTGADWLVFTAGQCRGAYASPNEALERYCGPGHASRRDLVREVASGVKALGKRFIVYSAVDFAEDGCTNHAMQAGLDWKVDSPDRRVFERRWSEVLGIWSRRLGTDCDGWFLDGCSPKLYPAGMNWSLWLKACRAGNPAAAVTFNSAVYDYSDPLGPSDFTPGETGMLTEAEKVVSRLKNIPGCQRHYLFPIDGYWGAYWKWPDGKWAKAAALRKERPEMFDQAHLDALCARGEFPSPVYTRSRLRSFILAARAAGAAVTVNVGIGPTGRLNPKSVELLGGIVSR